MKMAAKKRSTNTRAGAEDLRHTEARRKNNPPAGIAPTYEVMRERQVQQYAYDPHEDPRLEWAGKAEHTSLEVDIAPLHIHEYISTKAILEAVRRPELVQPDLFGWTSLPAHQEIQFYKYDVDWTNRLILGDSLLVMNSLLVKEGMAGKVQCIYIDPPYGIKYASNFQPRIDRRDVKDKDGDLTREPEQIKAYRATWKLGIHSYLTCLRDRLLLCRDLLHESGSIFVQINDENLHLVRCLLEEVYGRENFVGLIPFRTTISQPSRFSPSVCDYLLWYAKNYDEAKFRPRHFDKDPGEPGASTYTQVGLPDGFRRRMTVDEGRNLALLPTKSKVFSTTALTQRGTARVQTTHEGLQQLRMAERVVQVGENLRYVRYLDDLPYVGGINLWNDTITGSFTDPKIFTVQTNTKVVERCILMTTDPGDLVFDPTCGSGTTAYCAEKWGRRRITCDTSRVALAIARRRLMTAKFDYYELRDPDRGPAGGFIYETVPHITLESIAKNTEIDAIAAKYQPQIDRALADLNRALRKRWQEWEVPHEVPHPVWPEEAQGAYEQLRSLKAKGVLSQKEREQVAGLLQAIWRLAGHRWERLEDVPDPVPDPDRPAAAKEALRRFWQWKRKKRQEIDESIQRNAPQETLYDRPQVTRGVLRVSGPFTVEATPVPAVEDPTQAPVPQFEEQDAQQRVSDRGGDYLTTMQNFLNQQGGVLFPGGRKPEVKNLRPLHLGYLHAEADAQQNGKRLRVAISFGPQHGPVIAYQVYEAIPTARMNGYDLLIFAGFAFDPEAQALIQKAPVAELQVQFANVAPDVLVGDLLKTTRASQIFTVFGQPDVRVEKQKDGTFVVELRGVDIYDPVKGRVNSTPGEDVAAWFLDTDYDGKTFKISQAFFPGDANAWEKLQRALRVQIPSEVFERTHGTTSFPFKSGEHKRVAAKVIDFRGNEVVRVLPLDRVDHGGGR